MALDPLLRSAIAAKIAAGLNDDAVAAWAEGMGVPDLDADAIAFIRLGLDMAARHEGAEAGALTRADINEYLLTMRRQMTSLAGLFEVQAFEIQRQNLALDDKAVKAHVATSEQFRKGLATLLDANDEKKGDADVPTVAALFSRLFDARRGNAGR